MRTPRTLAFTGLRRKMSREDAAHRFIIASEAGIDRPGLVDALLAPLAPDVYAYQRERGLSPEEIAGALETLARRVMVSSPQ